MKATDACTHPLPAGDSSAGRLAVEAEELGFDSIIALGTSGFFQGRVNVLQGYLITETTVRGVLGAVRTCPPGTAAVLVNAGDLAFNRAVISLQGVHILRQIARTPKHSFDHVAARSAAERTVAIDIDIRPLWETRGAERQRVLARYAQVLILQRRYSFPFTISSNAASVIDLRSVRAMAALCRLFGMEEEEVQSALAGAARVFGRGSPVRVV
jgi:ribonuclease P/MRP protein subunit RPP1